MRTRMLLLIGVGALAVGLAPAQNPPKKLDVEIEVPYVPTPQKVVDKMLEMASIKDGQTVYDLGCGDGRIVITAVKQFKAGKGLGVDFNPERLKDCEKSMVDAMLSPDQRKKLTFKQGDVLKMTPDEFKDVDVVTLYLLPEVNLKLKPVLLKGLKNGARVVSHAFDMGDWAPDKTVQVPDENGSERTVHLWTIKK